MLILNDEDISSITQSAIAIASEVVEDETAAASLIKSKEDANVYYGRQHPNEAPDIHSNLDNDSIAIARSHLFMSSVDSVGYIEP